MQQNRDPRSDPPFPRGPDAILQRATLGFILAENPTRFTQGELTHIFAADREDAAQRRAVIGAIEQLVAAGLLYRDGHFVTPTHAALHFDHLARRAWEVGVILKAC